MTSRPRRFPFKAAASRLAMPPSSSAAAAAGVALIAGVANAISRSVSSNGNASRKATSIPNATPNLRTKGASDDSRRRNYLIAPPPLFPLVPAFARQTYRYDTAPSTQITNYPNTNANHNYRNANHPNIHPHNTRRYEVDPGRRLVLRTETRNRPRPQRLRQRTHDGDQTAKRRPMGESLF